MVANIFFYGKISFGKKIALYVIITIPRQSSDTFSSSFARAKRALMHSGV